MTVHIHAEHDSADDETLINRGFDETMTRIKQLVETGLDKPEATVTIAPSHSRT